MTQRTLRNSGVATFADTPNGPYSYYPGLFFVSGGTLVNEPGASFAITTDCSIYGYVGSPSGGTITNYGVFSKTGGPGTSEVGVAYSYSSPVVFNQAGAGRVEVASGKLVFDGGGTLGGTGTLVADPNTTLGFGGGTFAVTATSGISGAGKVEFRAGTVTIDGTYGVTGTTLIDGGTAAFDAAASSASAAISDGTLTGPGTVSITNLTWTGGTMSGVGVTVVQGTLAISGYEQVLTQRTLRNSGVATFADTPNGPYSYYPGLFFVSGGTLVNEPGASFAITTDCSIYGYVGSPSGGTITNYGVFSKTGGPGTSEVGVAYSYSSPVVFNQAGAGRVEVASGTLQFDGGGTSTDSSAFGTSGGGKLIFPANITYVMGGATSIFGDGVFIQGATIRIDGPSVTASKLEFDSGLLTGGGSLTVTDLIWVTGPMTGTGQTTVTGVLSLPGNVERDVIGRTLNTQGSFDLTTAGLTKVSSGGAWNNSGIFTWEGTGGLQFEQSTWTNTGSMTLSGSGLVYLASSAWNNSNQLTVDGPAPLQVFGPWTNSGTINMAGTGAITVGDLWTNSGTVNLVGTGELDAYYAGNLINTGSLTWNGLGAIWLSGSQWLNDGEWTWSGSGSLTLSDNAKIDNLASGTLTATGDQSITYGDSVGSRVPSFHNEGTFLKQGSARTLVIDVPWTNSGTITVESGTLSLSRSGSSGQGANFNVAAGANLLLPSGDDTMNDGTSLTGAGTVKIDGATVAIQGSVTATYILFDSGVVSGPGTLSVAELTWNGGAMNGPGTVNATGSMSVGGSVVVDDTNLIVSGDGVVTNAGFMSLKEGASLRNTGLLTFADAGSATFAYSSLTNEGTLNRAGSGALSFFGGGEVLANRGSLNWSGVGPLRLDFDTATNQGHWTWSGPQFDVLGSSGTIENQPGGLFELATDGSFNWQGSFLNEGTLIKSAGAGTARSSSVFNNSGSVSILAGTLAIEMGSSTGSFSIGAGATLEFSPVVGSPLVPVFSLGDGTAITGAGEAAIRGGTLNIDGPVSAANLTLESGQLGGPADLTIHGTLTWSGGSMGGTGLTQVATDGRLNLAGGNSFTSLRTINNRGLNVSSLPAGVFVSTDDTFETLAAALGPALAGFASVASGQIGAKAIPFLGTPSGSAYLDRLLQSFQTSLADAIGGVHVQTIQSAIFDALGPNGGTCW